MRNTGECAVEAQPLSSSSIMSIPSQQTALAILTPRGAWSLVPTGVDLPGPGELLIRVEATALNPVDWKLQVTEYASVLKEYPAILGADAAGVVVAVGEGVTNFAVGDRTYVSDEMFLSRSRLEFPQGA